MSTYSLKVNNKSLNDGTIAVYQDAPKTAGTTVSVFTLAWFTKFAYKGTSVTFNWELDYNFVWSRSGILQPGVVFNASQNPDADPDKGPNSITLSYDQDRDAFKFEEPTTDSSSKGTLIVSTSPQVPQSKQEDNGAYAAAVGIGMTNNGTHVVQTQPNMKVTFTPHPTYYVVFGNYQTGEIVDVQTIMGGSQALDYRSVVQREVTLTDQNEWKMER